MRVSMDIIAYAIMAPFPTLPSKHTGRPGKLLTTIGVLFYIHFWNLSLVEHHGVLHATSIISVAAIEETSSMLSEREGESLVKGGDGRVICLRHSTAIVTVTLVNRAILHALFDRLGLMADRLFGSLADTDQQNKLTGRLRWCTLKA
jgi:hypothetical protein